MKEEEAWRKLTTEINKLSVEYAKLKNSPKSFETEREEEFKEDQFRAEMQNENSMKL